MWCINIDFYRKIYIAVRSRFLSSAFKFLYTIAYFFHLLELSASERSVRMSRHLFKFHGPSINICFISILCILRHKISWQLYLWGMILSLLWNTALSPFNAFKIDSIWYNKKISIPVFVVINFTQYFSASLLFSTF